VLEVASVSGLTFTPAEVAAACEQALATIETRCEQLARRGQFLTEAGVAEWPDGTLTLRYRFRHALYQQAVFAQLGGGQKMRLHRVIGERKAAGYGEQVSEIAGELARHFEQGRAYERAVHYRQVAAEHAWYRSGVHETLTHCTKGLTLLAHLPDTPARARQELALRRLLASAQLAVLGVAAAALGRNLERARRVCQEVDEREALIPVLVDLSRFYLWRAQSAAAEELAEQERGLLERVDEPALALQLQIPLGSFDLVRGAPQPALVQYERAVSLFDPQAPATLWHALSVDPLTLALLHGSLSAWLAGRPEQARSWLQRGLARAEAVAHPPTLGYAVIVGALVHRCLREPQEAWRLAQRSVDVAREHGFALYTLMGEALQSWGKGPQSELAAGLPALAKTLAAYRATGARLFVPFWLAALAEGYLAVGRIPQGLAVVTEALELSETTLDRFWHAELYRLYGQLVCRRLERALKRRGEQAPLVSTGSRPSMFASAEECFEQALAVARHQGAHALELRAGMSLSWLWKEQGKSAEARQLLAEVYGWFTEGFDTADLQEAKALLEELS
jgi:predicted ATPase